MTGSHSWNATRKYYLKKGFAKPNQPLHHWALHRNQGIGKYAPDWLKNQMWNLKSFSTQSMHMRAGYGFNFGRKKDLVHSEGLYTELLLGLKQEAFQ